jgi:hypothetical protein
MCIQQLVRSIVCLFEPTVDFRVFPTFGLSRSIYRVVALESIHDCLTLRGTTDFKINEGLVNKALLTGNLILASRGSGPIDIIVRMEAAVPAPSPAVATTPVTVSSSGAIDTPNPLSAEEARMISKASTVLLAFPLFMPPRGPMSTKSSSPRPGSGTSEISMYSIPLLEVNSTILIYSR